MKLHMPSCGVTHICWWVRWWSPASAYRIFWLLFGDRQKERGLLRQRKIKVFLYSLYLVGLGCNLRFILREDFDLNQFRLREAS